MDDVIKPSMTETDDFQFNNDEILQYIIDSVHCAICMSIMPECIGCVNCTVLFCEDCILDLTSESKKNSFGRHFNCPNCKGESITVPNIYVQKLIGRFTIKCMDCDKTMKHCELKRHLEICPNRNMPLPPATPNKKNELEASQIEQDHQLALRLARQYETNVPTAFQPPLPTAMPHSKAIDNLLPRHLRIYPQNRRNFVFTQHGPPYLRIAKNRNRKFK